MDMTLEVVVLPVTDVGRAKDFYGKLGWRLDAGRGVEVSEVSHDEGGVFHHAGTAGRVPRRDLEGRSYCSFASVKDPDGNNWIPQEIVTRLPGR